VLTNVWPLSFFYIIKATAKVNSSEVPDLPPTLSLVFEPPPIQDIATAPDPAIAVQNHQQHQNKSTLKLSRKRSVLASGPSPAVAIALEAASKATPVTAEERHKYHQNARLTVKQATQLFQLCSQEIKMRGEFPDA
jgi:hypothetical protein